MVGPPVAATIQARQVMMWAREQFGAELEWAIEDCRQLSARLERDLLSAGQKVVRVTTEVDGPDSGVSAHPRR